MTDGDSTLPSVESLYDRGWRQGSIFELDLAVSTAGLGADGAAETRKLSFDRWIVATQDCDLTNALADEAAAIIEVRPVEEGSCLWGIRSSKMRLTVEFYVSSQSPRLHVSPELLAVRAEPSRHDALEDSRAIAFKTWLGYRYDRPAVPDEFVSLARAIATAIRVNGDPSLTDETHDVLVQFTDGNPARYALTGVVVDEQATERVEQWLTNAALTVDVALGTMARVPLVVTKARLSLDFVEQSYSADLSEITWRKSTPRGAIR